MKRNKLFTFIDFDKIKISVIYFITLLMLSSCQINYDSKEPEKSILCDAENVNESGDLFLYKRKLYDIEFGAGVTRSSECSFSGKYSSKTDSAFPYGILYEIKNLNANNIYNISVWRKSNDTNGVIALQGWKNDETKYYDKIIKAVVEKSNGWEKIEGKFTVPDNKNVTKLKIFVLNPTKNIIYFDDLMITDETEN